MPSNKKTQKKPVKKPTKKQEKTVIVLFFAHWCGHCQSMYPEWEKLQKEYENNDKFILREIEHGNIEQDKHILEKEYGISPIQVQGFPTLVKFNPHKAAEYYEGGERTQSNMRTWLNIPIKIVEKKEPDSLYGGYKIPIVGKIKTYSKKKTTSKKSKSRNKIKYRRSMSSAKK
jgi:thiol-disulfide isomerase/thioredoxin